MRFTVTVLALLVAHAAQAETTLNTPVAGAWTLKRGTTAVATASGPMSDCRARAAVDAESRRATATYTCTQPESLTVTYTVAPVQCATTQPSSDTQQSTCPAGTFGTFTQARSYTLQASPTCWSAGAWSPTTAPTGACSTVTPSGSYSTNFDASENPISEAGRWARAVNPMTNARSANGIAFGTNGITNGYDDSYALLAGSFGPNQTIEAVVFRDQSLSPGPTHEVELLLRGSDNTGGASGYECLFNWYGGTAIVRWNGWTGGFTVLSTTGQGTLGRDLVTGDVIKATIVGNVISTYINGLLMARATDNTIATGRPGMGFFIRPGGSNALLGLTSYSVTSY